MKLKTLARIRLIAVIAFLSPAAHAQTFSVIHNFQGPEGAGPEAGVTIRGGILYGTAGGGYSCPGGGSCGTAYQVKQVGSNWIASAIYLFPTTGSGRGYSPVGRVVFSPDGHPYGLTNVGPGDGGVVYRLTPPLSICKTAACLWTANELHTFTDHGTDGAYPLFVDLIWDQQGNIYGTTGSGGTIDCGTVFQMTGSGNNWTETPVYSFMGLDDGCTPQSGVVMDSSGNLFGTTYAHGAHFEGTVYELTNDPQSGWKKTSIYAFAGASDGGAPVAGVIMDGSGNLYGATTTDGLLGGGTVFELSPVGNAYMLTVLYSFSGGSGCGPAASLTMDIAGNLYGTTRCDGTNSSGNVFELTNAANGWVFTSLHDFTGGADGGYPSSQVTIDTDGTLYGTTSLGGDPVCNCGSVWMIKP